MATVSAKEIYDRVSGARIPDSLLDDAIDLVSHSPRMIPDRGDIVDRLQDDEHTAVLRKEVTDVVTLVTGALDAPSIEIYREFIDYAEMQVPLIEPFDDLTRLLRTELGVRLAVDALDDVVERREVVTENLQHALAVLGESRPLACFLIDDVD